MKRQIQFIILSLFTVLFASCNLAHAQALNKLQTRCPNSSAYQNFTLNGNGNANFTTCSGGQVQINGVPIPNTGTASGTANTLPRFGTNNTLSDSFASQTTTGFQIFNPSTDNYYFRINRSGGAAGFALSNLAGNRGVYLDNTTGLTLDNNAGNINFRNPSTATAYVQFTAADAFTIQSNATSAFAALDLAGQTAAFRFINGFNVTANSGEIALGDYNEDENGTTFYINDTAQTFTFGNSSNLGRVVLNSVNRFDLQRTITGAGVTGNQTINQPNGTVNFAAGAGTAGLTVTNSTVTANSLILAIAQTNDTTCSVKNVVAGAGSFVIRMNANCTAETRVAFWVTN